MDLDEGLYNESSDLPQIDTTVPVLESKPPPIPLSSPSESAILAEKQQLLQMQLQEASKTYESLKNYLKRTW
jgi:hypothetical protein